MEETEKRGIKDILFQQVGISLPSLSPKNNKKTTNGEEANCRMDLPPALKKGACFVAEVPHPWEWPAIESWEETNMKFFLKKNTKNKTICFLVN